MDQVGPVAGGQAHGEQSERVVGTRGHDGGQRVTGGGVFLAHGLGRIPGRILLLLDDVSQAQRGAPIHFPDAHRIGNDLAAAIAVRLRVVVEAMLGQIDDDAFTRTRRQNMLIRDNEGLARTGQPGIYPGIDANDLLGPQAEFAREVVQRVLVHRHHRLILAHDGISARFGDGVDGGLRQLRGAEGQQDCASGHLQGQAGRRKSEFSDGFHQLSVARTRHLLRPAGNAVVPRAAMLGMELPGMTTGD